MTTSKTTPSEQIGKLLIEVEKYKNLAAEYWEAMRKRDVKIRILQQSIFGAVRWYEEKGYTIYHAHPELLDEIPLTSCYWDAQEGERVFRGGQPRISVQYPSLGRTIQAGVGDAEEIVLHIL